MVLKKTVNYYIRALHRDIGFFVIGLTVIYCISGILLIYKDTGFLKEEKNIEKQLSPEINTQELGRVLHIKGFEVLKTEGDFVYFQNGTFNRATGMVSYKAETLPFILEKFNGLHKSSSKNTAHWFAITYGLLLMFLAVSSFWMYRPGTTLFSRGIFISGAGFTGALIILLI